MQTRRDQLQAYRFQNRRALAALVTGEPNVLEPPMRRLTVTTLSGIMVAILIAAGFALVGVFKPVTGSAWKDAGAIIDVRGTGARYILIKNKLYSVANYTSAALILGGQSNPQTPHLVYVDPGDIAGVQLGYQVGTPGLPDDLPSASGLINSGWTVCSKQIQHGAAASQAQVHAYLGAGAPTSSIGSDALYVTTPHLASPSAGYLLANGTRFQVSSSAIAGLLGLPTQPVMVGTAFVNAIQKGPDLSPLPIQGVGPSGFTTAITVPGIPQLRVGQVITAADTKAHYLALSDGYAPLNGITYQLAEALTIANPALRAQVTIASAAALTGQKRSDQWTTLQSTALRGLDQLPSTPAVAPRAATDGGACATYSTSTKGYTFSVPSGALSTVGASSAVTESDTSYKRGRADVVTIPSGRAALVQSADDPSADFLVADSGQLFPIKPQTSDSSSSNDAGPTVVLKALGFGGSPVHQLPSAFLSLLTLGPALDPAAAQKRS